MDHFGVIHFYTYLAGCILIILLPGPNSMFVLAVSLRNGKSKAFRAALAIGVGDTILMLLTVAGAATILNTNPNLFLFLKLSGAAYLAYIGLRLLIQVYKEITGRIEETEAENIQTNKEKGFFRKALIISLLNPKAIFFFLSFFVQFVDQDYPYPIVPFMILTVVTLVISFTFLTVMIFTGNRMKSFFRKYSYLRYILETTVGLMFMGFALSLADVFN